MRIRRASLVAGFCLSLNVSGAFAQTVRVPGDYPTIQAAVAAVLSGNLPNGTEIDVQPGSYNEALLINTTSRSLTIRGVGGATATVVNAAGTGQSALRILRAGGTVQIVGLTFRGGTGVPGTGGGFTFEDASPLVAGVVFEQNTGFDAGGGVLTRSNARFSDCFIRNNSAARFGGGVVITTGSRPVFSNCQISDNTSGTGGPGSGNIGSGGGVHVNDASPTFRGCLITRNRAKFAAGGILHMGVFGSSYGPATLLLEDTEVSNNTATRFSNGDNPAEGGGVHIEDNAVAYLVRANVLNNTANTSGGLSAYRARYEVTSSRIEGNHAQDALGVGGFGGGIGASSNNLSLPLRAASVISLTDTVVRNNDSRVGGGIFATGDQLCGSPTPNCNPSTAPRATVVVSDSLIDGNSAGLYGGGIRADRTDLTVTNSHILNNTVGASGASYGGGILMALGTAASITGTTIAGNTVANIGGGLFIDDGSTITMDQSIVYANTAPTGGGLYVGSTGAPSGIIQASTIADNTGYQIHEQACNPLQRTILNYQNNRITPTSGHTDLYFSTCGGATTSIGAFNSLPSGRASGNTSSTPSFMTFLSTPAVGPSVLSWSVSRAASVTISSGVGTVSGNTGSTVVAPPGATTYTLTASGGPGTSATASVLAESSWGASTDKPITADFDGDGRVDLAVYRPSTGQWFVARSRGGVLQQAWGAPSLGDTPVPADYDGDGKADVAVLRMTTGQWIILNSGSLTTTVISWGAPSLGDTPVPGDYNGDGRADIGVYRRSTGEWFIRLSGGGTRQVSWGAPSLGDIAVPADYDGDGKTDIAVYRSSTGQWFVSRSTSGPLTVAWGAPSLGDSPLPADYDGDGKADIAIVRGQTGEWFIRRSLGGSLVAAWGAGDAHVPGDYDGNGHADIAIWQATGGFWIIRP